MLWRNDRGPLFDDAFEKAARDGLTNILINGKAACASPVVAIRRTTNVRGEKWATSRMKGRARGLLTCVATTETWLYAVVDGGRRCAR